jgi:hypothetical protein
MTTQHLNRAAELAPTPTSRGHATRGAWIRHYAAQALDDFTGPTTPVVGACANHPSQFGAYAWPDGTFRCAPCTDEPRVVAWPTADTDTPCPCGNTTTAGDTYAVLDTSPASTCCAECTEAD